MTNAPRRAGRSVEFLCPGMADMPTRVRQVFADCKFRRGVRVRSGSCARCLLPVGALSTATPPYMGGEGNARARVPVLSPGDRSRWPAGTSENRERFACDSSTIRFRFVDESRAKRVRRQRNAPPGGMPNGAPHGLSRGGLPRHWGQMVRGRPVLREVEAAYDYAAPFVLFVDFCRLASQRILDQRQQGDLSHTVAI